MILRVLVLTVAVLGWSLPAAAIDPQTADTAPSALDQSVPPPPAVAPTADKPRPIEPPKPVTKPRPAVEKPQPEPPPPPPPATTAEVLPPPPPAEPAPATAAAVPVAIGGGFPAGCWLLAFAMLIIGFAAGFVGRYFWSRRQLGGMTVRIGTWRGTP